MGATTDFPGHIYSRSHACPQVPIISKVENLVPGPHHSYSLCVHALITQHIWGLERSEPCSANLTSRT